MADSDFSQVKTSYDDVNTALENLIGNISSGSSSSGGQGLINRQVFSKSGSYTYTPTSGTKKIIVKLCGAGGGGGGCLAPGGGYYSASQGGSGGTYAETPMITVPVTTISITVGSGGAGGSAGFNPGSNGGVSSFGTTITCPGGVGGIGDTYHSGGPPLIISTVSQPSTATGSVALCIIGGSALGSGSANGGSVLVIGSTGGSSVFGIGAQGPWSGSFTSPALSIANTGTGNNATTPGSGGSGSIANGDQTGASNSYAGGNGADGIVIVEEYA